MIAVKMIRLGAFTALAVAVTSGCHSIKSTLYEPDETGERKPKRLCGIPVRVQVPTHIQITMTQTHYFDEKWNEMQIRPTVELTHKLIESCEIYTTDFKRPASGQIDLKLDMDPEKRYFTKMNHETTDTTITDVAALVRKVIGASPNLAAALIKGQAKISKTDGTPPSLNMQKVVVAEGLFDLRRPNLEGRIQEFYDQQLNKCAELCNNNNGNGCMPQITFVTPP